MRRPAPNEVAVADINGDGKPDIVTSTGVSRTIQGGVVTNNPGVLLQTTTGVFGAAARSSLNARAQRAKWTRRSIPCIVRAA